jgi:hypothetical protein
MWSSGWLRLHEWAFDRAGGRRDRDLGGRACWTDYHVSFTWMDDIEALASRLARST